MVSDKQRKISLLENRREVFHQIIHDLKSPLASIIGLSEVFLRMLFENLNDNQKQVLNRINVHARFALELVEDILDVENISSGKLKVRPTMVSLTKFLNDVLQSHIIQAAEKNIQLNLEVKDDLVVSTDERRLRQVLNNLINNALKFSKQETKVTLKLGKDDKYFYLDVKDQGVGIKAEEIDLLFVPFSQLSNRPTGNEKSTGLGLCIVKNLVEILQGEISVFSEYGEGSTFTIKLPLNWEEQN